MNLLIILAGVAAFRVLPVREYPDVELPVVTVQTSYVGASAQTVENTITVPIEEAINGVNGIRTIRSTSGLGTSNIEIELSVDRNIDLAATDVQNAIQTVLARLPPDAERPVVQKAQGGSRALIWLAVQSDHHSPHDLTDIAERVVKTRLQILPGVASTGRRIERSLIFISKPAVGAAVRAPERKIRVLYHRVRLGLQLRARA